MGGGGRIYNRKQLVPKLSGCLLKKRQEIRIIKYIQQLLRTQTDTDQSSKWANVSLATLA